MRMLDIEYMQMEYSAIKDLQHAEAGWVGGKQKNTEFTEKYTAALKAQVKAMILTKIAMFGMVMLTQKFAKDAPILAAAFGAIAGAMMGYAITAQLAATSTGALAVSWIPIHGQVSAGAAYAANMVYGALIMASFNVAMQQMMLLSQKRMFSHSHARKQ